MIMFMVGLLYRLRLYCCVAETKPRNSCGFVGAHHLAPQAPRTEVTLDSHVCSRRELTIEDAWHRLDLCTTPCRVQPSRTHASFSGKGGERESYTRYVVCSGVHLFSFCECITCVPLFTQCVVSQTAAALLRARHISWRLHTHAKAAQRRNTSCSDTASKMPVHDPARNDSPLARARAAHNKDH